MPMSESKPKVVAIIQARVGSTRLPGKILIDIAGEPMLQRVIERVKQATLLDQIILATTELPEDDKVINLAKKLNLEVYRGSSEDVLERYYGAAEKYDAETIVRITSDCPLIDPKIIDLVVGNHLEERADYTSNTIKRTFPRGWDVEVFNMAVLNIIQGVATDPYQREHVTPYFYEYQDNFKILNVEAEGNLYRPELRLCVDEINDLTLVRAVYEALGSKGDFDAADIIDLFDRRPELENINAEVKQKKR